VKVLIDLDVNQIYIFLTVVNQMSIDSQYEIKSLKIFLLNEQAIQSTAKLIFHLKINSFQQQLKA